LTALPYLCGGVDAADLALGVALLLWAAAVACCAGVALGAAPARSALQRVLPAACGLALAAFAVGVAGYVGSLFAGQAFPGLPSGPFWFAAAYRHAAWDLADVSLLILTPLAASVGLGVGAVELCAARISLPGPRRLAGVKGWAIGAAVALLGVGFMLRTWWVARDHFHWASVVCIALLNGFGLSLLWLFSEERPGEVRNKTGSFAALSSSGLFASTRFAWRLTALATLLASCAGALQELHSGRVLSQDPRAWLFALGALAASQLLFTHFCTGLIRILRVRHTAAGARKRFAGCVLGLWFVPWLFAIGLGTFGKLQDWLWLAALSPGYALTLAHQLRDRFVQLDLAFWIHVASCLVWLGAGLAASHVSQRAAKGAHK
jgi:hypothetical protein